MQTRHGRSAGGGGKDSTHQQATYLVGKAGLYGGVFGRIDFGSYSDYKTIQMKNLKEKAKSYFEQHPGVDLFFATEDGMFFTKANRGYGQDHANKTGQELHSFMRNDLEEKNEAPDFPEGEPTDKWKVAEIQALLQSKGVEFDAKANKKELLEKHEEFKAFEDQENSKKETENPNENE